MQKTNAWISQRIFFFVLLALTGGYFIPLTPTLALKNLSLALFSYMTFATALATSFNEFLKVSRNPKIPLYILTVVHIVTPIVAWIIGILFFPNHHLIRIGYLISAVIGTLMGWPVVIMTQSVVLSFLVCSAIGMFFGWYPAKKASNLNPIDALRFE